MGQDRAASQSCPAALPAHLPATASKSGHCRRSAASHLADILQQAAHAPTHPPAYLPLLPGQAAAGAAPLATWPTSWGAPSWCAARQRQRWQWTRSSGWVGGWVHM